MASATLSPLLLVFSWFLAACLMLIDIYLFVRENGFKIKKFYWEDDLYRFRIEQLISFLIASFLVLFSVVQFAYYFLDALNVLKIDRSGFQNTVIQSLQTIVIGLIQFVASIAFTCVGLFFAIISWIKKKFQPKIFDSEFDAFINTKTGKVIFKKHAKIEWSLENILFYEEIEKYEKIPSRKHAHRRSKEILENYILVGSPLEVNLSSDVRKNTIKKVNHFEEYKEVYQSIFIDSVKETKRNMRDTFSRICLTNEYEEWKKSSNIVVDDETK